MSLPDLPFYRQFKPMNVVELQTSKTVAVDRGYFRMSLVDMRLGRDVVGPAVLAPVLHAIFALKQSMTGLHEVILGASSFPNKTVDNLHRIYIAPQALTPIVPFTGSKVDCQVGLFAVPVKDLASELLELLEALAGTVQRPDIIAALGIADTLRKGMNALLGTKGANLLLGWQGEIGHMAEIRQQYMIVTPPGVIFEKQKLRISGGRLYFAEQPVQHVNYIVLAVEVASSRPDWRTLEEIKPSLEAWNSARSIYGLSADEYNKRVSDLLNALRTSPNIVPLDAERIAIEEIRPLLQLGNDVQTSLFRSAGFNLTELNLKQQEGYQTPRDFIQLDVSGADR